MATSSFAPLSIAGGSNLKARQHFLGGSNLQAQQHFFIKSNSFGRKRNSVSLGTSRKVSINAQYNDGSRGGGSDFAAGFLLGGAIFGIVAYVFAPQIRRSLLNEDEYGFQKAKRPIYYDEDLVHKTRQTLIAKISQLNSAIDNVSSRLRGGNHSPSVPLEPDSEVEATM